MRRLAWKLSVLGWTVLHLYLNLVRVPDALRPAVLATRDGDVFPMVMVVAMFVAVNASLLSLLVALRTVLK